MMLAVPLFEATFQVYQCMLIQTVYDLIAIRGRANKEDVDFLTDTWFPFHQLLTVFTLRAVWEIAVAGVVSRWYFQDPGTSNFDWRALLYGGFWILIDWSLHFFLLTDGGDFGATGRAVTALTAAFTKSLGSACIGGLVMVPIHFLQVLYSTAKWVEDQVKKAQGWNPISWLAFLPLRIPVWIVRFLLGLAVTWLEHMLQLTYVHCGMFGTSFLESAKSTWALTRSDGAVTFMSGVVSDKVLGFVCVNAALPLWFGVSVALPVLCDYFGYTNDVGNTWRPPTVRASDNPMYWAVIEVGPWTHFTYYVWFACYYMFAVALWFLRGACLTVTVCCLEEINAGGPPERWRAEPALKNAMVNYQRQRGRGSWLDTVFNLAVYLGLATLAYLLVVSR